MDWTRTLTAPRTPPQYPSALRTLRALAAPVLSALAATAIIALLVARFGVPPVAIGAAGLFAALVLLRYPDAATPIAVVLLYSNGAVVARSSTPAFVAISASPVFLLLIPCIYHVVIRRKPFRVDGVYLLMLAFLAVQLLSAFVARDLGVALAQVGEYLGEGLTLYLLTLNAIRSRAALVRTMTAVVVAVACLSTLSLYQAASGSYRQQFGGLAQRQLRHVEEAKAAGNLTPELQLGVVGVAQRAAGPLGDPNRYAQILLVALPFAIYLFRRRATSEGRLAAGVATVLCAAAVALTYSRGAFLTVAALTVPLIVWRYVRGQHMAAAGLLLVVAVAVLAPQYPERMATLIQAAALSTFDRGDTGPDPAIRGRATEMLSALDVVVDHPVLGVGPGQYVPFYSVDYQLGDGTRFRTLREPRPAHNLLLSIAAETGLVGLAVFLWIPAYSLSRLLGRRRLRAAGDPDGSLLAATFALSVLAYLGTGMFLHLAYERYFWLLLALASVTVIVIDEDRER